MCEKYVTTKPSVLSSAKQIEFGSGNKSYSEVIASRISQYKSYQQVISHMDRIL